MVGTPYLEFAVDRDAIARHGLNVADVQDVIEMAIGGMPATMTVEGRERSLVRVRYQRELRDNIEALGRIVVPLRRAPRCRWASLPGLITCAGRT